MRGVIFDKSLKVPPFIFGSMGKKLNHQICSRFEQTLVLGYAFGIAIKNDPVPIFPRFESFAVDYCRERQSFCRHQWEHDKDSRRSLIKICAQSVALIGQRQYDLDII